MDDRLYSAVAPILSSIDRSIDRCSFDWCNGEFSQFISSRCEAVISCFSFKLIDLLSQKKSVYSFVSATSTYSAGLYIYVACGRSGFDGGEGSSHHLHSLICWPTLNCGSQFYRRSSNESTRLVRANLLSRCLIHVCINGLHTSKSYTLFSISRRRG